jgi:hypothetical protein
MIDGMPPFKEAHHPIFREEFESTFATIQRNIAYAGDYHRRP